MAPLLVPLLLFLLFYSFSRELVPEAERVLGRSVPDVELITDSGERVRLSTLAEGRPLILSFIYTRCTSACPMIVRGIKEAVEGLKGFKVLLIDFDGRDTLGDLRRFRELRGIPEDWSLAKAGDLLGLTSSLDFRFHYDEDTNMFYHPNVLIVLTPDLKVSSYFLGVSYDRKKLEKAIRTASRGDVNLNPVRSFLLRCFRYDPVTGTYTIDWSFVAMVLGGLLPILGMAYYLFIRDLLRRFFHRAGGELS